MSNSVVTQRLPVLVTIIVAFMLAAMPLPDAVAAFRPDWLALTMIYWGMMLPRSWSVGSAWLVGLVLDVAYGSILGQHALVMSVVVFLTVRLHLLMRVFPPLQLAATVFALLALYRFGLFWINGVARIEVEPVGYWGPVIAGAIVWPLVSGALSGVRLRAQLR